MFGLKSPDLDFSKESTHGILKHRYAEFIVWEWDLVVSLVRHLTTGRFLKLEDHKKYYSGMKGSLGIRNYNYKEEGGREVAHRTTLADPCLL